LILSFFSTFKIVRAEWLSGWGKRVKLVIDQNDIDSDLSGFPVLIYLSASSGRGPDDVSFVFDEIQSDSNRKKIAVTTSDGTTQCYVEIERWDQASEKAWLWAKVPTVSGTVDTVLYLYYNRTHSDNTAYVGDTDSTPAQNVWDTNHKGVWHLDEETNGTAVMKDSTSNDNDGTPRYGAVLGATGRAGKAVDIDGSNDYVYCPDSSSLDISGTALTMSVWICPDFDATRIPNAITVDKRGGANAAAYRLFWKGSTDSEFDWGLRITAGGTDTNLFTTSVTWTVDTWHYLVGTYDGSNMRIYWDGAQENSLAKTGSISTSDYQLGIAGYYEANPFDGTVDEVRISDYPRSAAWIKASYESERDHLIDYGGEEGSSSFSAFIDEASIAIGTSETTLATLSTSFSAGNNFVIAIIEFQSTATLDPAISAGNLKLTKSGTTLRSNQYVITISSSDPQNQKWFALMAFDSGAGANPSYDVRATAQGTGISGETKILAIGGLTGSSVQGSSITIDDVETTLATLPTSLPAGDNVVVAILESVNTATGARNLGNPSFRISRGSALADGQYWMSHLGKATIPRWHVHLIPYLDVGAPANPTYTASSQASWKGSIDGRATIVAFSVTSMSGLSAAYSDGGDTVLGTSETTMNTLSTSFQSGSEVVVIASEQFYWGASSGTDYINAGNNKLQQNDQSAGQATNQYTLTHGDFIDDDTGRGFGLLNRFVSTLTNPQYKVKATMVNANTVKGESKIIAIAYKPPGPAPEFPVGPALALIICLPIFFIARRRARAEPPHGIFPIRTEWKNGVWRVTTSSWPCSRPSTREAEETT